MAKDDNEEGKPNTKPTLDALPITKVEHSDVYLEIYKAYSNANLGSLKLGAQLGLISQRWVESKNVSYMDAAVSYCYQNGLPILPELLVHVHDAMQRRIKDGTAPNRAFRESHRERLFEEMGKMIYCGATLKRASELAAFASSRTPFPFKASSLNKEFSQHKEKYLALAKSLFEDDSLSESDRQTYIKQWKQMFDMDFDISDEIKGERR